jgi:hypothetical protein
MPHRCAGRNQPGQMVANGLTWAPYFLAAGALLLGIPVYLTGRRHMGQPEPMPPYR